MTLTTPITTVRPGCGRPGTATSALTRHHPSGPPARLCSGRVAAALLGLPGPPEAYALLVSDLRPSPPATAGGAAGATASLGGTGPAADRSVSTAVGVHPVSALRRSPTREPGRWLRVADPDPQRRGHLGQSEGHRPHPSDRQRPLGHPSAQDSPADPNRSLTKNSLYTHRPGRRRVRCGVTVRSPKPPLRNADLAPYTRSLLNCMVKAFAKPLAAQGFVLTAPKIKVYKKPRSSRRAAGSTRRAPRVLLLSEPDDLLAGDPGRRSRGVHLRPAGLRRSGRPRVRTPPAGRDRDGHRVRAAVLRRGQGKARGIG